MGLSSTGDEYNLRYDAAVLDISQLQNTIEDVILYDETIEEHDNNVRKYLRRCRHHNITLIRDQFTFAAENVKLLDSK